MQRRADQTVQEPPRTKRAFGDGKHARHQHQVREEEDVERTENSQSSQSLSRERRSLDQNGIC
eukprot:952714-Rhodomonas_salina.1